MGADEMVVDDRPRLRWSAAVIAVATLVSGVVLSPSPDAERLVAHVDRSFPLPGDLVEFFVGDLFAEDSGMTRTSASR